MTNFDVTDTSAIAPPRTRSPIALPCTAAAPQVVISFMTLDEGFSNPTPQQTRRLGECRDISREAVTGSESFWCSCFDAGSDRYDANRFSIHKVSP